MGLYARLKAATAGFIAGDAIERSTGPGDDYWYQPIGGGNPAGVRVTPDNAMKAVGVFACVSLLAEILASLPLHMYERLGNGGRKLAVTHPLEDLISTQPNETDTAVDFWGMMVIHACLGGTGYARIEAGARGTVDALYPLHRNLVTPERLPRSALGDNRWRFRYRNPVTNAEEIILQEEMLRIPGLIAGGIEGMNICQRAEDAIAIGIAADQMAARVFGQGMNMSVILTHPGKLSEPARDNLLKAIEKKTTGIKNFFRPLLLQEGMKAEKVSQTAEQAQLLEARKWQTLEAARAFRIPAHMVGISDGATHSNVEEQSLNFVRYTLIPWATRVEQAIRRDLIIKPARAKYTAKFNFEGLLRGNTQMRSDYFAKALGTGGAPGWLGVNEVRVIEGFNPIDDPQFEKPPIGTNSVPADSNPPRQAPPASEPEDDEEAARSAKDEGAKCFPSPADAVRRDEARAAAGLPTRPEIAAAIVAKEVKALRKAAMRFGDVAAWRTYARSFFGGQVSDVVRRLGVEKEAASLYCKARSTQCEAELPDVVLAHLEQEGAAELLMMTETVPA